MAAHRKISSDALEHGPQVVAARGRHWAHFSRSTFRLGLDMRMLNRIAVYVAVLRFLAHGLRVLVLARRHLHDSAPALETGAGQLYKASNSIA